MKITIHSIDRGSGLPPSIRFLRNTSIPVEIDWERDQPSPVVFTVIGGSSQTGKAELVGSHELQQSGRITVRGTSQTEPGHSGQITVQADWNGRTVAVSDGFSVCAHPNAVWNGPECLPHASADISGDVAGMLVQIRITSDSGAVSDLDLIRDLELVSDLYGYEGPGVANWPAKPQTAKSEPIRAYMTDTHTTALAMLKGHVRRFQKQAGRWCNDQLDVFSCPRCGMQPDVHESYVVIPNSGFIVERRFYPSIEGRIRHTIRKYPASVQIGSSYSDAGPGETLEITLDIQDRLVSEDEAARFEEAMFEMPVLRQVSKGSELSE